MAAPPLTTTTTLSISLSLSSSLFSTMAAYSSMAAVFTPSPSSTTTATLFSTSVVNPRISLSSVNRRRRPPLSVSATVSPPPSPVVDRGADDLVSDILSKVIETDRGVLLSRDEHKLVGEIATQLQNYCVDAPVKCPLIFGEWDVVYCSNPTSPGGGYRSAIGRLIFNTTEMIQAVEAPDIIRNKVAFSAFGFLDGEVSLKGKLIALDERWIQVIFEAPKLKVGGLDLQYGGESEVKLQITYIDEKIRLGVGSRGSLFVFLRRK